MEPNSEVYTPSRLYARAGWFGLAGAVICVLCGLRAPFAFIPAFLCCITTIGLFLLASCSSIVVSEHQFLLGTRAVAWREVREVNSTKLVSPLVLKLTLTNNRKKLLIYPGEPDRISKLVNQLRLNSVQATFDGVSHKDYWTWTSMGALRGSHPTADQPVRMISQEDEDEIERMYRQLKSVGRLDSRSDSEKP